MDAPTALSIVTSTIATVQGTLSYLLPLAIPTVVIVVALFAMLRWAFGATRRG